MRYNSIFLISNNLTLAEKIAKEIWLNNKRWSIVGVRDCFDSDFIKYLKKEKTIVITDGKCFENIKPNKFIKYCEEYRICPIFITDKIKGFGLQHNMYSALEEIFLDSLEYIHSDKDDDSYKELVDILKVYLW